MFISLTYGFSLSFQVLYNEILCSGILCLVSHRCFQIIPFGSVVTCSIFVGSRLNKSRKPGGSFSFSTGFLHVKFSAYSYLVIHQMVT